MAINLQNSEHRNKLQRAVRSAFENESTTRRRRGMLYDMYRDEPGIRALYDLNNDRDYGCYLNYMQKFVRGHLLSVAYGTPRWQVKSRTAAGRGFDNRIQQFLNRYSELLDLRRVFRQAALDSAFGRAIIKVITSIAPKGVTSPFAPRAFRIDPDCLIVDQSAATFEEASFIGDVYLVPLEEARLHPEFNSGLAAQLTPWRASTSSGSYNRFDDDDFAEDMTRLVDIYLPSAGMIATWPAPTDSFDQIGALEPLNVKLPLVNPYAVLQLMYAPSTLAEMSRLWSLRGLHLLSNDMYTKAANQARHSQRNPIGEIGSETDLQNALDAGDNSPVFLEDKSKLDLYVIPGPDPSILQLAALSGQAFSQEAGNLEVALGQSTGAQTARQTQALIGQISAAQALDREAFENFMSSVGKKLATLAFYDETLELEVQQRVPGTQYSVNVGWAPPQMLPRAAEIDSFNFSVEPYSTTFRTPEARLGQLQQASQLVAQWVMLAAQGAPINLQAIISDVEDAFDLIGNVSEWWTGEKPTPQERTVDTYTSLAGPNQGSTVTYQGGLGGNQQAGFVNPTPIETTGGMQGVP